MLKKMPNILIIGMAMLLLAAPLAKANHGGGGGGKHGSKMCAMKGGGGDFEKKFYYKSHFILGNSDELGLSEKQTAEIESLVTQVKKGLIKQDADIEVLELDIKNLMHQDSIDVEAVNKLVDQKFELKKTKAKFLVEGIAKLKQSISDDQQAKMKELFKGKGEHHSEKS
jgi:hypothetical protein